MPKIKSFAAPWLNEPAPGHKLFELSTEDSKLPNALAYGRKAKTGPRRTIADRGTEIFVAAGKQIRWGDLAYLKESWESKRNGSHARIKREGSTSDGSFEIYDEEANGSGQPSAGSTDGYRYIKTPAADDIRQLVMSPQKDMLAVLTSHTVHVCLLPDHGHLHAKDTTIFKPKFWTLGPTTHVTSRSAIVSAIWHPLGVNGSCLVTVTEDAVVRVWELSITDRWSFDSPTLDIDLKRLADGTSLDQDFGASTSATNKTFSPDQFDMEVAAACFPNRGSGGWSSMTLWVAMVGGDVYALSPLLPKRWSPPPTLIPSLTVSVVGKVAANKDDPDVTAHDKLLAQQQQEWMSDLDNQEPKVVKDSVGDSYSEVYTRPSQPGVVPKLQGPFQLIANPEDEQDDEAELKDIYVIGETTNMADLMMGEGENELDMAEYDQEGLSLSVICLLSTSGQVKVCLAFDDVEAQWLPDRKTRPKRSSLQSEPPSLLSFQTFDTVKPAELTPDSWPVFSADITSRYAFYVTHPAGITYVSLAPWVSRLESELGNISKAGTEFRIDLLMKQTSDRERIYTQKHGQNVLAAATVIKHPDLGHFVLSATHNDPVTIFFESPVLDVLPVKSDSPALHFDQVEVPQPLMMCPPRPLFHPSEKLNQGSALPAWQEHLRSSKRRPLLQQEVRLSTATLEVFDDGHRLVSNEVFDLNNVVAELFRKCEALHYELREQIKKTNEVRNRIEQITGEESGDDEPVSDNMIVESRMREAKRKQQEINERMEAIRRKLNRATSRDLSDKERAWMEEVGELESSVLGSEDQETTTSNKGKQAVAWKRFEEAKALKDALFSQAEQLQKKGSDGEGGANSEGSSGTVVASPGGGMRIPADIRKARVAQVRSSVERNSAMLDAIKSRLEAQLESVSVSE
ncbi:hypothetical protein B0H66DRAFT_210019 [Apodospora peruviana]|uniref:Uncharacterized protein n=1 Tax=Apodospora peruviana TaxID=516989 RepID=A0AAE0M7R5_9PEZI|nr:hypothetical protein B0H66DRAFT_210019 [Apodospora peruviana]